MKKSFGKMLLLAQVGIALSCAVLATDSNATAVRALPQMNEEAIISQMINAVKSGDVNQVRGLIARGANPSETDPETGKSLLMIAAENGNLELVRMLVVGGANIAYENIFGSSNNKTALDCAQNHADVVQYLKDQLITAVKEWRGEEVRYLLNKGADAKQIDPVTGKSALMIAAEEGNVDMAQLLINHHANIDYVNRNQGGENETALICAAKNGHAAIIESLLNAGLHAPNGISFIDNRDSGSKSALMWAAMNGHAEAVSVLLRYNANYRFTDNSGNTALMLAAREDRITAVKALLDHIGETVDFTNNEGRTASDLGNDECKAIIEKHKKKRNAKVRAWNRD